MKKLFFFLLVFFFSIQLTLSQKVDSISVEQSGDFIKIRYKILNSTSNQIYRVKVLCSMDGGLNYEVRSITGDAGDMVIGGKSEYWVVWDVLKDVEELESAEFVVRAELIQDNTKVRIKDKNWSDKKVHVMAVWDLNSRGNLYGLRVGYMGNWGISAKVSVGSVIDDFVLGSEGNETEVPLLNTSLDLTKRIVNDKQMFQLHYLIGVGYCKVKAEQDYMPQNMSGNIYDMYFGINMGLIFDIGRMCISGGGTMFLPDTKVEEGYNLKPGTLSVGLGIKF